MADNSASVVTTCHMSQLEQENERLRQQLEQERARVAELEAVLQSAINGMDSVEAPDLEPYIDSASAALNKGGQGE